MAFDHFTERLDQAGPRDALAFLMREHKLKQADLADIAWVLVPD
jgi:hypothetical protein